MKVGKPSLGGRLPVKVGKVMFGVPQGSLVAHSDLHGGKITYVKNAGRLHVLTESGEVLDVPADLACLILKRVFDSD